MQLKDIKKSITEMSEDEAFQLILDIRQERSAFSFIKKKAKRVSKGKPKSSSKKATKTTTKRKNKLNVNNLPKDVADELLKSMGINLEELKNNE